MLYVSGKKRVGKSKTIKAIYLRFSFLKRQKELLIAISTNAIMANISGTTIYRLLSIQDFIQKQQCIPKNFWQNCLAPISDEISIVFLRLLEIIDMCLS